MQVKPLTFRQANEYVKQFHRHHGPVGGGKYCLGAYNNGCLVGVAVCARPVSRVLDDGATIEISRLCTDGTPNACSFLYGACCRVAKAMGYKKAITYILMSENGASLKASNFTLEKEKAGGNSWNCKSRPREDKGPLEYKKRYGKML